MKKTWKIVPFLFFSVAAFAPAEAYETKWTDKKFGDTTSPDGADSTFKLDGVIYTGYEFLDKEVNGQPDSAGPTSENQGFNVGRAYLNFRGNVNDGAFKGWGFRITTDLAPAASMVDGCTGSCTKNNDYIRALKYAYVMIPVSFIPGAQIRIGQQHVPLVDGQAGVSLQEEWGYRYVAKATLDETGLAPSTDRGLAFIKKSDYYGVHLLLANGEGYHKNNAQGISQTPTLQDLASGNGDSYGMDLYGMISLVPTGKSKDFHFAVNFPFRAYNVIGVSDTQFQYTTADFTGATPTMSTYIGQKRAAQDMLYGVEGDAEFTLSGVKMGLGGGVMLKKDKQGDAYRLSTAGFTPLNDIYLGDDSQGNVQYVFARLELNRFGAFARYTTGTTTSRLDGKVHTPSGSSWLKQATMLDMQNNVMGDLALSDAMNTIDTGRGRFHNYLTGVTYRANKRFRISFGVSQLSGNNAQGKEFRTNNLERIGPEGAATTNLATQLENRADIKAMLGYQPNGNLDLNDFIGQRILNRQMFIRSEYAF